MKNLQKGFVVPLLIVIISLLVIGGGIYIYENKKAEAPAVVNTEIQQSNQNLQQTNTQTPPLVNSSEPCTRNGSMGTYKCNSPVLKVNGPQELDLNQLGTWTVNAYSPNDKGEGSTLTYSVKWGDVAVVPKFGTEYPPFTHAYSQFGTYTLVFTVRDSTGAQTATSTSVSVINSTSPGLNTTSNWKTYTNSNPSFSFNYPSSWNPPVINQQNTRVFTDFGNGFSVTTGFYYDQVKGRNSTVLEIINSYKNSSTIKNVQTENIKVDGHLATKITYYGSDTKKNYTDAYIYQDQQIQEKFIELNADNSVDATTFNQILSTFKFTN